MMIAEGTLNGTIDAPTLPPIDEVDTSDSLGNISSSLARTSWKPCGSWATSCW